MKLKEKIPQEPRVSVIFHYINIDPDRPEFMPDEMGFDQYLVPVEEELPVLKSRKAPAVTEDDENVIITGKDFRFVFNKHTAAFTDIVKDGVSYLAGPMSVNIWRAPTDNDRNIRNAWESAGMDKALPKVYKVETEEKDGYAVLKVEYSIAAISLQPILRIRAAYKVSQDGSLDIQMKAARVPIMPFLPRFGVRLFLDDSFEALSYYGYGPNESYIDKRRSSRLDAFTSTVSGEFENYIKPQENGSHYGCKEMKLCSKKGGCVTVQGKDFSFNASHYTQEELTKKKHNFELEKSPYTVLCVDERQSGIGSNSCGPVLQEKYQLGKRLELNVRLTFGA